MTARDIREIAGRRFGDLVVAEIGRSRKHIHELERTYPSAERREIAQRLIDHRKAQAGAEGAISGIFGIFGIPADLVLVTYFQICLAVEIATLFRRDLKSRRAQDELVDVLAYANGMGPATRSGPKVVAEVARALLTRGGLPSVGKAFPIVGGLVTAYLNNRDLQRVGDEAVRFYGDGKFRQRS
jgi:hypothetical protein